MAQEWKKMSCKAWSLFFTTRGVDITDRLARDMHVIS
jgi:hypothetical protein